MNSENPKLRRQNLTTNFESQRGRLRSFIQKMVQNPSDAEDVVQDVFEELAQTSDLETTIENIGAWLVRVARNKVLDRFRRRKTEDEYRLFIQDSDTEADDSKSDTNPEEALQREDLREEIIEALNALPEEQKDVFIQHELEGQSFEEISAKTGVSVNTLLSRKRYAVLALREHLMEIYDEL